ncbi:MAG: TetR family transcriptional regulator, partial [Lachnospiraceae bacterium]|nr:TetR family transcriptional regulator [Lachnospiraceae bacterium]
MSDSSITKKALADALKKLMKKEGFDRVSVSDICNSCGMNR